ncbi:MAG: bestrophin family ion channel [Planctomycetia bacterium]
MIEYNRYSWWKTTFSFRGTALPLSLSRVIIFLLYSILIQAIYDLGLDTGVFSDKHFLGIDPAGHAVLGSLIGFLIVFRINASNARYWEGRSHWGSLINTSRNLVRFASQYTSNSAELANLVTGYVICLRRLLQGQRDLEEAEIYLPESVSRRAVKFGNPATGVSLAISEWVHMNFRKGTLDSTMVRHMEDLVSRLVDAQGGCEKIQKTPLPFVYVSMVKQLILIYLTTLPVVLCERCGWWSPVLMAAISMGMFGLEEASVEIEDPFGTEDNCLDLLACTMTIARDTAQLASEHVGGESMTA